MSQIAMKRARDDQSRVILRRHYGNIPCYYCDKDTHIYQNCPDRPCYLCKTAGHIAHFCPHRNTQLHQRAEKQTQTDIKHQRNKSLYRLLHDDLNLHHFARLRELTPSEIPRPALKMYESMRNAQIRIQADSFHSSRITAAEWAPDGSFIVSGDKRGTMNIWPIGPGISSHPFQPCVFDLNRVRTSASFAIHRCNIYTFAFDPQSQNRIFTCSGDGTLCVSDVQVSCTGEATDEINNPSTDVLFDFNPDGWVSPSTWRMASAVAYDVGRNCAYAGSSDGTIVRVDARTHRTNRTSNTECISRGRFHSNKVTHLAFNPVQSNMMVSSSNDTRVCLWDMRKFVPGSPLGSFQHERIVSSAVFSPNTGRKLLTTSYDNRLRIWDDINAFQGDANQFVDSLPSNTFVHSHDFHRYITPFRATWDPKSDDDTFVIGRYLGEGFVDPSDPSDPGVMLRPIDIFSTKQKEPVLSLIDRNGTLIFTINRFSPVHNCILSAASQSLFIWSANREEQSKRGNGHRNGLVLRRGGGNNDDDDDDENGNDDNGGATGTGRRQKKRKLSVQLEKNNYRRTPRTAKK